MKDSLGWLEFAASAFAEKDGRRPKIIALQSTIKGDAVRIFGQGIRKGHLVLLDIYSKHSKMEYSTELPATLRAIRAALDLTQEQLGERLGVSFATINRWEGGTSNPQRAAQAAIALLAAEAGVVGDASGASAAVDVSRRRSRIIKSAPQSPSTKPMEQMLWDAACSIRGEKDAAKFKDYLLPLVFLKRLSDVFDDEVSRLGVWAAEAQARDC